MLPLDRRRSISPVPSLCTERRRSDPCPVEAENPNEDWEPSSELHDLIKGISERAAEQELVHDQRYCDALEGWKETEKPDE